jgi:hypothetical protein
MSVADVLAFKDQLNLLLGALISYAGFYVQGKVVSKQAKEKLLLEKIERAYTLCQLIYEGHKREISNARLNFLTNRELFISNRLHPGKEMSELKMLLRCYVPELISFEKTLNVSHKPMKEEIFQQLDDAAIHGRSIDANSFELLMTECDRHLTHLGETTVNLKQKLAIEAGRNVGR